MDFGERSDNPFSRRPSPVDRPRKRSFAAAVKLLALVAVCLALVVIVGSQSRRWVAHRMTQDFDVLAVEEKQVRLAQIAGLDHFGIQLLVQALATEEDRVAKTAYDLLDDQQSMWSSISQRESLRRHHAMIDALQSFAVQIPDQRTGWATALLQKSKLAASGEAGPATQDLLRRAAEAIELFALSDRSGPSILDHQTLDDDYPRRLAVQTPDPPISSSVESPATARSSSPASAATTVPPPRIVARSSSQPELKAAPAPTRVQETSLRSELGEPVLLRDTQSQLASPTANVHSVTHLVDSPLTTYDDQSVMHWLGSPHQVMREKARTELLTRGFDEAQIGLATQIASGDVATRLALVDAIARSPEIDPRPWLYMLLDDASREVRLRVVSVLATMSDPGVAEQLRSRLSGEADGAVTALIERTLQLR